MFTLAVIRRTIRLTATALALLLAATSLAPAVSGAQPNQGGGTGNADYCQAMLERVARYHAIAQDTSQPKSVRAFYESRAAATLFRAQEAGCDYSSARADVHVATPRTRATASARRAATRRLRIDARRSSHRTARSAKRSTAGGAHTPNPQSTVAEIKAHPSGDPKLDQYCSDVAQLIDDAEKQADFALIHGDNAGAAAWYELADYYVDQATQNGCRFIFLRAQHAVLTHTQAVTATKR